MTVMELKKDFKEQYGKDFPFAEHGFTSFIEYLTSIPEICHVANSHQSNPLVFPISSENSHHIEEMIARSKKKPSKRPLPRFHPNFKRQAPPLMSVSPFSSRNDGYYQNCRPLPYESRYKNKNIPPRLMKSQTQCQNFPSSSEDQHVRKKNDAEPRINLETQFLRGKDREDSVMSTNQTERNRTSPVTYSEMPYERDKYNASAANSRITLDVIIEDVRKLIDNNPTGVPVHRVSKEIFSNEEYRHVMTRNMISNVYEFLLNCRDFFNVHDDVVYSKSPFQTKDLNGYSTERRTDYVEDLLNSSNEESSEEETKGIIKESTRDTEFNDEEMVGDRVISNFRHLLRIYPEGIMCSDLPKYYEKEFHVPLNIQDWGYRSVIQMIGQLPNVFHYVRKNSCSDWTLFDAQARSNSDSKNYNLLNQKLSLCSYYKNLLGLLAEEPSGTLYSDFLEICKKKYNRDILSELKPLGFTSLKFFLVEMRRTLDSNKEDVPNNYHRKEEFKKPTVAALPDIDYLVSVLFPPNVCDKDFVLERVEFELNSITVVRVTEVTNPGCFWMVMEKYWNELNVMMEELDKFYTNKESDEKFCMPMCTITEGQLCVAPYGLDCEWHRARILSCAYTDKVKVDYIDYGTIGMVHKSQLKFLHTDFAVLPQQYIKAKLFGIRPIDQSWTKNDGVKFLEVVSNRAYYAHIKKLDSEATFAEILLYEPTPTSDHDFVVNTHLVKLGLAMYLKPRVQKKTDETIMSNYNKNGMSHLSLTPDPEFHSQECLQIPPASSQRTPSPTLCVNQSMLASANEVKEENPMLNFEDNNIDALTSTFRLLQTPSPTPPSPVPPVTQPLKPPRQPPPGFTEKDLIQPVLYNSTFPTRSYVENDVRNSALNNIENNPMWYKILLDTLMQQQIYQQNQQLGTSVLRHLLSQYNTPLAAQWPTVNNSLQHQTLLTALINSVTQQSSRPVQELVDIPQATLFNSVPSTPIEENQPKMPLNPSETSSIKGIWSPVEVKKEVLEKITLNTNGNSERSTSPLSSVSYSSSIQKVECETPPKTPTFSLNDTYDRKTPDNWEEILQFDSKKDCTSNSGNKPSTPSAIKNSPNTAYNGRKRETYFNDDEIEDVRMIVPSGTKVSSHPNQVISLSMLKRLEEQEKPKGPLRLVEVGTCCLHIMRVRGKTVVSTEEVVKTFTAFGGVHVIVQLVEAKRIKFPFSDLYINDHRELFAEIKKTNLHQLLKKAGNCLKRMNIIPIESLPQLLTILNIKTPRLFGDLTKVINQYKGNEEWC